jgi:hypothetical protein
MNSSDQAELPLQRSLPARRLAPQSTSTLEMDTRRQVSASAAEDRWRMRYVRWTGTPQSTAVGVSVGVGMQRLTPALPLEASRTSSQMAPELGVRVRTGWRDDRRVDVDAWRSYERALPGEADDGPSNNARVELQFRAPKDANGLDVPRGAFGIQTSANSQWVLRAKRGGPMVYYRARW